MRLAASKSIILDTEGGLSESTPEETVMNYRFAIALAAVAFIAGCNTMHGIGEDVSAGGRKVEDTLKKDKSSPSTTTPSSPATTNPSTTPSDTSMSRPPSNTTTQ